MKSITFSSIKNKIALRTTKIECSPMRIYNHSYRNTIPASTSYDNAFTDFTYSARMYMRRDINLCAKISPHIRTYSIRLDAGCIMSDYKG